MFSRDFLLQIAATYGLTSEQTGVFLKRLLEGRSHIQIASALGITKAACLKRMAEVYKKFGISGQGRGKDGELRKLLLEQLKHYEVSTASDTNLTDRIDSLSDRLSTMERATLQELEGDLTTVAQVPNSSTHLNSDGSYQISYHNLPARTNNFIGRAEDLNRILNCFSEDHANPVITVDGIGGVGKTAFVLEAAYRCLEARDSRKLSKAPKFDAIIFASAKESYLLPTGIVKRLGAQRTLSEIYRAIALTLNEPCITQLSGEEQYERVKLSLAKQRTLLIVDNFETLKDEDKDKVLSFLYELPRNVKSVITTREQRVIHVSIRLNDLPEEDRLALIRQQIEEKAITLTDKQVSLLGHASGGVPLVIVYAVGRLANSISLETVLEDLKSAKGDLAHFLFHKSVEELKDHPAYKVLLALAIFRKPPFLETVTEVAGLRAEPISTVNRALERLQQLSLVRQQDGRYGMLALTHEYALTELNASPDFAKEVRERWFKSYLESARKYGGDDWGEWHQQYDHLDDEWINFLAVLDWCALQERYSDVKELWHYLSKFANLYGYWDDRLKWLDWLIQSSQRRGDWATYIEVATAFSWTLILQDSPQNLAEAEKLLQEVWKLRERAHPVDQYTLAENIGVLRIRQGNYEEAHDWFKEYKNLVKKAAVDDQQWHRSEIRFLYYQAEILYRKGEYEQAKSLYKQVEQLAVKIAWQRFVVNAQSWLASIAIKQDDLHEAENLLHICLPVAERNNDKRRTAFCQYVFACLEKSKGNPKEAKKWADKALDTVERLKIERGVTEIRSFLQNLMPS
jgi:tetratricopeptide (TPR) repeat protein